MTENANKTQFLRVPSKERIQVHEDLGDLVKKMGFELVESGNTEYHKKENTFYNEIFKNEYGNTIIAKSSEKDGIPTKGDPDGKNNFIVIPGNSCSEDVKGTIKDWARTNKVRYEGDNS